MLAVAWSNDVLRGDRSDFDRLLAAGGDGLVRRDADGGRAGGFLDNTRGRAAVGGQREDKLGGEQQVRAPHAHGMACERSSSSSNL